MLKETKLGDLEEHPIEVNIFLISNRKKRSRKKRSKKKRKRKTK